MRPKLVLIAAALLSVYLGAAQSRSPSLDELRASLEAGRFAEAERGARARLEELKAQGEDDPLAIARVLDVLTQSLCKSSKSGPETEELANRALNIKTETLGPDHIELAASLDNLGRLMHSRGRYEDAKRYLRRSLQIRESSLGADDPEVALSLSLLGWMYYETEEFETARSMYERSLRIFEATPAEHSSGVTRTLNNYAILLKTVGDHAEARQRYEQVLAIYDSDPGANDSTVATTLNNLAILLKIQGDYAAALPRYERAIRLGRATWGEDNSTTAQFVSNLAALYARMGDVASARRLHERSLEIIRARNGADHPLVAFVLNNLGALHVDAGDADRARPLLERALRIRERSFGPDHVKVARVLNNLGYLYTREREFELAKEVYDRSLTILEGALGADHPETARLLESLAEVLRRTGDRGAALGHLERAREIYERTLGAEHPRVAGAYVALSSLLLDMGDGAAALDLALRADEIGREHLRLTARTLPERQALAYATERPAGQSLALTVLAGGKGAGSADRVWNALIRSRALVLDEMRVRHGALSQAEEQARELALASERLTNLLMAKESNVERHRRLLERARKERDRAERALAEASLHFRRTREATGRGFSQVASALPPGSALVAYVRYDRDGPSGSVPSYLALVLQSGKRSPAWAALGSASHIESLVDRWREEIASARSTKPHRRRTAEARYAAVSDELRRVIWDPVAHHVQGSRRVFVVPDGALLLVNLATLSNGNGGFLLETAPPIHYLSAERDLIRQGEPAPPGRGLLVVGGADFGEVPSKTGSTAPPDCTDFDSMQFAPLPGSVREIDTIASLWSEWTPEEGGGPVSRLHGLAATETAFKNGASGHRVIHVATHAFFVSDRCAVEVPRHDAGEASARGALVARPDGDAIVLSGLAFAGANQRGRRAGTGVGILTAEEIAAIDLTGVDWVVLSGCDTGIGTIRAGEGVLGLGRAFRIAGAETLIISLWPVEDASTRAWMRRLYGSRLGGSGSAEAIHDANLGTLRARRENGESTHPFYWGAFVAVGGWE